MYLTQLVLCIMNIWGKSERIIVSQSCPTLCDPMDCTLLDFSVHRIFQEGIPEWVAFPPSGDLPDPGIQLGSPELQADSLPSEPPGKKDRCFFPTCGQSQVTPCAIFFVCFGWFLGETWDKLSRIPLDKVVPWPLWLNIYWRWSSKGENIWKSLVVPKFFLVMMWFVKQRPPVQKRSELTVLNCLRVPQVSGLWQNQLQVD